MNNVVTYSEITVNGSENPWNFSEYFINSYGFTAEEFHTYMMGFHSETPVFDNYTLLQSNIRITFRKNKVLWDAKYKALTGLSNYDPNAGFNETEHIEHSGNDTTTGGGSVEDDKNTYDNATLRPVGKSTNSSNATLQYGHKIDTNKTRFDGSPLNQIDNFMKVADFSLFDEIINSVLQAISCRVYIPQKPQATSNN